MKLVNFLKIKLSLLLLTILHISYIESLKYKSLSSFQNKNSTGTNASNTGNTNSTISNKTIDKDNNMTKSEKFEKAIFGEGDKNNTSLPAVNSRANDTGLCKIDGIKNTTNAVGVVGNDSYVDKYPYDLKRCDQVIMLKAKMINPINCRKSINVFITLSAYYVNVFSHKNSERLLRSINNKEFDGLPEMQKNSTECITFFPKKYDKLILCFSSVKLAKIIYEDYFKLFSCSHGYGVDGVDCLDKINFTMKGPLGKFGPKLKQDFLKAKFEFITKLTGKEPEMDFGKMKVNPYYSTKKVPGE